MLLSSWNRKYPPFPLLSHFSVVVCLRCLLHHIMLLIAHTFRENRKFVFIIIVQFIMSANCRIRFGLKIAFVYLYITPSHYHHCANLSEYIELIKCLSAIFCRVCVGYILAWRSHSFICTLHHLIIIIVQTYLKILTACQLYLVECVSKISAFSQLSILQYVGLCVFSLPIYPVMIGRIYTLSYHNHQIGRMNFYPLFRV